MPYYRRRAYKRSRGSRDKYSVHQKAFSFTAAASPTTTAQLIVPSTATEGMRKVKHITVNLTPLGPEGESTAIWWALVYVPQGTTAGSITLASTAALTDMYEPNQFVMNCGIADPDAGPIRFSSPISRNLNNGDVIVLLVRHSLGSSIEIRGTCRYAITLQ